MRVRYLRTHAIQFVELAHMMRLCVGMTLSLSYWSGTSNTEMCADPASPNGESGQWLVFEVTDTGCGISQHALSSLFTEYVQVLLLLSNAL